MKACLKEYFAQEEEYRGMSLVPPFILGICVIAAFPEEIEKPAVLCIYLRYIWCHCPFKEFVAWQLFMKNSRSQMLYKYVCQL